MTEYKKLCQKWTEESTVVWPTKPTKYYIDDALEIYDEWVIGMMKDKTVKSILICTVGKMAAFNHIKRISILIKKHTYDIVDITSTHIKTKCGKDIYVAYDGLKHRGVKSDRVIVALEKYEKYPDGWYDSFWKPVIEPILSMEQTRMVIYLKAEE